MSTLLPESGERALILAPRGRDAAVASTILRDAGVRADTCSSLAGLAQELKRGADIAIVTEEALGGLDLRTMIAWVTAQPAWSDFPFVVLTRHGGGLERNPTAARLTQTLGNVSFLERPFHPTTLVSMVETGLRGRRRQQECRRLNEELESRVQERTAELAAANRQLLMQIEERERVETTLRQMQRLEAIGQLTSGVAHDFNNLLTVVLGNIGFLEREMATVGIEGKPVQRLGYMRAAAERGAKLTDQLLSFSRRQKLEPKATDLNGSVTSMRDLLQSTMGGSVRIETTLAPDLWPALVDLTQLELAILNLAINARDAMPTGGTLSVETANISLGAPALPEEPPAGDYVIVRVTDTGSGMPPQVRAKAFEPFFTTKEVGKGSGLGLSQVLGFAKQSGGGVRMRSAPDAGTNIEIYLPRASVPPADGAAPAAFLNEPGVARASIVVVDDDDQVRDVTAAMLRDLGYTVSEAGSGGAALELVQTRPDIDLLLIDLAMPGMSGVEVAQRVGRMRPGLPILFVTGYADHKALEGIGEAQIIGKPFVDSELTEKVRVALRCSQQSKTRSPSPPEATRERVVIRTRPE